MDYAAVKSVERTVYEKLIGPEISCGLIELVFSAEINRIRSECEDEDTFKREIEPVCDALQDFRRVKWIIARWDYTSGVYTNGNIRRDAPISKSEIEEQSTKAA